MFFEGGKGVRRRFLNWLHVIRLCQAIKGCKYAPSNDIKILMISSFGPTAMVVDVFGQLHCVCVCV